MQWIVLRSCVWKLFISKRGKCHRVMLLLLAASQWTHYVMITHWYFEATLRRRFDVIMMFMCPLDLCWFKISYSLLDILLLLPVPIILYSEWTVNTLFCERGSAIWHPVTFSYIDWTHWDQDEMDSISQTTFWNVFTSMKMSELQLKFHWRLFLRGQSTIS